VTADEARQRAITSLLDVVEELALGLAHGQRPGKDWADLVVTSFSEHRAELRDPEGHDAEPQ